MELRIRATKPQAEFYQLEHRFKLFCGGYGSGKSEAMVNSAMMDACQDSRALIAMYSPTYDLVRLITVPRLSERLADQGVRFNHNKADNIIYTSAPGWGDFVLRSLDRPERIVGYEAFRSHADELDTLKFEKAKTSWDRMIGRNRQRLPNGEMNRVSAYTTPEGFNFAHWRWVQNPTPEYGMIVAPSYSNPFLDKSYIESLRNTYPPNVAEAYIEGKFVNLVTGTVYNCYDRRRCRSREKIKFMEALYIGQDFNVGEMASTIYVKRPNGWHAVEELIGIYDTPSLIDTIKERYPGHKVYIYPDASGTSRKTVNASTSDIALLQQAGFTVKAKKTNPKVKDRIMAVNGAFSRGDLWVNDEACPTVAGCLERQSYDKNGEPDKANGDDHQNDATGYPIAYEMPIRKPVAEIPIKFAM